MNKSNFLRQIKLNLAQNDCKTAIETALEGYKKYKDNCFLNEIADIYIKMKNRKEAIKYLKQIYKNDSHNLSNIKLLAYNLFYIGNFKEALKYYKLVLDFEPQISANYFNIASMYHFMKKNKEAFDYYSFAIDLDSKNISALNNLGALYYENKYFKEAEPYFKRAIKIAPNHPEAYHHMGVILRDYYNDLKMSKYYLKKALILDPNYLLNSYQLGLTYKKMGEKDTAKKLFERCLELNPNHKDSQKELASI